MAKKEEKPEVLNSDKLLLKKKPGLVSRLFFWWMLPIFYYGSKRDLQESDLVSTKKLFNSGPLTDRLESAWLDETKRAKESGKEPSLIKTLFRTFKWRFFVGFIPIGITTAFRTYQPTLFAKLLEYWRPDSDMSLQDATYYAIAMVLSSFCSAFTMQHGIILQSQLGMMMRVGTSSLIYRKMLRLNTESLLDTAAGKIVNLLSNDASRFDMGFVFIHQAMLLPIQLAIIIYFMYDAVGISSIIGVCAMIALLLPLQAALSQMMRKVRSQAAVRTDTRIKVMDEIISGIQVIKMYAWEEPFAKVVHENRRHELNALKNSTVMRVGLLGFQVITERAALFLCILSYMVLGNQVTANIVYPLQQYFSIVQSGIGSYLPIGIAFMSEMIVSIGRMREFLLMEERPDLSLISREAEEEKKIIDKSRYDSNITLAAGKVNEGYQLTEKTPTKDETIIALKDCTSYWREDGPPALDHVTLSVKPGQLCAIVGAVGSGKSSLLQLLIKELPYKHGSVSVNGTVSYACQEAWLFPKSVRDNILFGSPYDAVKYKEVCKICCLERDFKQFVHGDQTLVGERGISLSGGQRARINLARAVYRDVDVYILDDPLSAVDAKVGRKLYNSCVSGYLADKTRILVTHQLHHLTTADTIVLLKEGKVSAIGTYQELTKNSKEFEYLLATLDSEKDKKEGKAGKGLSREVSNVSDVSEDLEENLAQKMAPEERTAGRMKFSVISTYCISGGAIFLTLTSLFILLTQVLATCTDYWISFWLNEVAEWQIDNGVNTDSSMTTLIGHFTNEQYLIIYGVLVSFVVIAVCMRAYLFTRLCTRASKALHDMMFTTILTAVMRFFDTSSTGRILNRFSKDMGALDEMLPRCMLDTTQLYLIMISVLVLNAIALPISLISTAILMVINFLMVRLYLNTSQSLKRIEGTTKSPVFGIVSSSLDGIATIRTSNAQKRLIGDFDEAQDVHTAAWNTYLAGAASFGHNLDTICTIYIAFVFAVFLYVDLGDAIPIGYVGLAVSQSLTLMLLLQFGARNAAEMLGQLTSVERVLEYTKLETEKNLKEGKIKTPVGWPRDGSICFDSVSMSYAPKDPPVLKNLSFKVAGGTKVGIVGRTGAGKSSLIAALFRFCDIEGSISIDGINTDDIAKQELRSRISIIPQEPVLFSATIRYNLDPFNNSTDEEIWKALELVELKEAVPSLDYKVSEGGSNFSVGQRQLVCLARAVLTSNKILVMDEATANVDPKTDSFIQKTIRSQFSECTVLTIAHRLHTIMDSDMVLVMDAGQVAEYDHPYTLMSEENSKLSSMARDTGSKMAEQLKLIAEEAYHKRNSERS